MKSYIVDSFTDAPFKGNPAGVCIVEKDLSDDMMLRIAQEFGLSETAFVAERNDGEFGIRYFSPKMEIPLCGHATLASAKVLFQITGRETLLFTTGHGISLPIAASNDAIAMQFPMYKTKPAQAPDELLAALGITQIQNAVFNDETKILLVEIESTETLKRLNPNFPALCDSHDGINGVLVTAPSSGDGFDFHSRYFWPWSGTNEDPVTGGTHTFLAPYWSERIGKSKLRSFQSSERTGFMEIEVHDESSLTILGKAVIVFAGELAVSST